MLEGTSLSEAAIEEPRGPTRACGMSNGYKKIV